MGYRGQLQLSTDSTKNGTSRKLYRECQLGKFLLFYVSDPPNSTSLYFQGFGPPKHKRQMGKIIPTKHAIYQHAKETVLLRLSSSAMSITTL
jgi:hypothetical protein